MSRRKSEIYSALWEACDKLRGGMDATQYKDYVLTMLFIKYVSDKAKVDPNFLVEVPIGASFDDMIKLKGTSNIGENINKQIIQKIAEANQNLLGVIDKVDFDDTQKLGTGKDLVDTLTGLIAVFQRDELDFSKNNAEGDDILGDAYEYLMSKFATESGKSKGQFYTPSEVSRIMAKVIGADKINKANTTLYDPTCGSGSLLLKVAYEAHTEVSIYGQEKDITTVGLALMNMYLHNNTMIEIQQGNTISDPKFTKNKGTELETFDYVVANPPFSTKAWSTGLTPNEDVFKRFELGVPPEKNGDYAFLLHILKSMKQTGHGAVILPNGVLFRGNAEAIIRKNIVDKRWIKGIISLPANLFYGTGIPACIIVLDKSKAETRQGIFMIDASKDFIKDGNKNRLRECDIKKIVDTFNNQIEIDKYSRLVLMKEIIEKNDYNLNIPRYIDTQDAEDIQDIKAHLEGGIPNFNIEEMYIYWNAFDSVKSDLFEPIDENYSRLKIDVSNIKATIYDSADFKTFKLAYNTIFTNWAGIKEQELKNIQLNTKPKFFIADLGESILEAYKTNKLIDKYSAYQILMEYWQEVMQDDVYIISEIGYKIELQKNIVKKNKKEVITYYCDLVPAELVENGYFSEDKKAIQDIENKLSKVQIQKEEFIEEYCAEDAVLDNSYFYNDGKIKKADAQKYVNANKTNSGYKEEVALLKTYLGYLETESKLNKELKDKNDKLYNKVIKKYSELTVDEVKMLVVNDKWLTTLSEKLEQQLSDLSQKLSQRVKELALRYETPIPQLEYEQEDLKKRVKQHLAAMGF